MLEHSGERGNSCDGYERWLWWAGEHAIAEWGWQGAVQQPGAYTDLVPKLTAQLHDYTLVLSNDRMSKMKNDLFSGLDL